MGESSPMHDQTQDTKRYNAEFNKYILHVLLFKNKIYEQFTEKQVRLEGMIYLKCFLLNIRNGESI